MADSCTLLAEGKIRFCCSCSDYPCQRLKALDRRYRTKYHMSMIANLDFIRSHGIKRFLELEEKKWRCTRCGGLICCHNNLCLTCDLDRLLQNKRYRREDPCYEIDE